MFRQKRLLQSLAVLAVCLLYLTWPLRVLADPTSTSSTNYSLQDTSIGAGSQNTNGISGCSTNYCANSSVGSLAVGNPSSTNYQLHAGYDTTNQPYLYFVVNNSNTDLGNLHTSSTAYTTGTFTVRTYQSGGYQIQTVSSPPSNGQGHNLSTATGSCTTNPAPGTEFFGMNLVANSYPASFGSNPVLNPVSGAAVGEAASGYNTTNCFKYNVGDVIAQSVPTGNTTGEADYTISYVYNINGGTPDGDYVFNDILVATATY